MIKTRRSAFVLILACLLASCSSSTGLQAGADSTAAAKPANAVTFLKGTYRKDGTCTLMQRGGEDLTALCNPYIGVIVLPEDQLPRFTFSQQQGEFWAFTSSGPASYADGGRVTVYPISHIYEMSSTRNILYKGECRLSFDGNYEDIACTTWTDDSRSQIAWRVTFVGKGDWRYQTHQAN